MLVSGSFKVTKYHAIDFGSILDPPDVLKMRATGSRISFFIDFLKTN